MEKQPKRHLHTPRIYFESVPDGGYIPYDRVSLNRWSALHTSKSLMVCFGVIAVLGAAVSPSPFAVLLSGAVLALGVWLLWPTNDAPILLLPFGLQWLAVSIKPLQTALMGTPLNDLADFSSSLTPAVYLAFAGVAALAIGLRVGAGRRPIDWNATMASEASRWPAAIILPISTAMIIAGHFLSVVAYFTGPAVQFFLALSGVRNVGLFILAYWCLSQGRALTLLAAVVAVEIVSGMTGFFAGFRESLSWCSLSRPWPLALASASAVSWARVSRCHFCC